MFPLLCRTHYQEKQYRWKDTPVAFGAFQCDCILKTLERMAAKRWTDKEGIEWPYWCGFELQISSHGAKKDETTVPDWLKPLCSVAASGQSFAHIGDRQGVRYSFKQLETIVKAIKTWCLRNDAKLPPVEALPITIGMVDEADLKEARNALRDATRLHTIAFNELQKYTQSRRLDSRMREKQLQMELHQRKKEMEAAELVVKTAKADARETNETVPGKRQAEKKIRKAASPALKPESSNDTEDDQSEQEVPGRKKKGIVLKVAQPTKRVKTENQ
jgi:hypothetical protein